MLVSLGGCADTPPAEVTATLAFVLPNGWTVTYASYVVLSSDQVPVVQGTEDLSASSAALAMNLLVPAGNGDVLQLTALTSGGISCSGTSAPFNVVSGMPTRVSLALSCLPPTPQADTCPTVNVQVPASSEANAPSGQIIVAASASDPDPGDALTYSWAAAAGTFADPTAASTYYVCTTIGPQTLVLNVDNNHVPTSCLETFLLPVDCLPATADAGTCADASCGPPAGS